MCRSTDEREEFVAVVGSLADVDMRPRTHSAAERDEELRGYSERVRLSVRLEHGYDAPDKSRVDYRRGIRYPGFVVYGDKIVR